jgi:hypothetical protein
MTISRRELLSGAAAAAIASGAVHAGPESSRRPARIPSPEELEAWRIDFKRRYHEAHTSFMHRPAPMGLEEVIEDEYDARTKAGARATLERLEAEVPRDPTSSFIGAAMAQGEGFGARRDGKLATQNPYHEGQTDAFMSWYAGWVQADPNLKLPRSRGYTPPPRR